MQQLSVPIYTHIYTSIHACFLSLSHVHVCTRTHTHLQISYELVHVSEFPENQS